MPSDCRERRGLAQRRMMRTLAPWVLENPIFFHMTNSSSSAVRDVLDQMREVGVLNNSREQNSWFVFEGRFRDDDLQLW